MKIRTVLLLSSILAYMQLSAFDNYGMLIGLNDAQYTQEFSTGEKKNSEFALRPKIAFFGEKHINAILSLKPSFGYNIRSFSLSKDGNNQASAADFHLANLGLSTNFYLIQDLSSPFLNLGINYDYLIFAENYKEHQIKKSQFTGSIGFGYNYLDLWYLQFDYFVPFNDFEVRPSFTLKEQLFSLTFGIHFNKLLDRRRGNKHQYDVTGCPRIPQPH